MPFIDRLWWLQSTPVAHLVSKSNHLVGAGLQIVHILGFVLMLASLLLVSLRLLGAVLPLRPAAEVARDGLRLLWTGFAMAVASGVMMFVATPVLYFYNPAFRWKMGFLVLAVLLQTLVFARLPAQSRPRPARVLAVIGTVGAWLAIAFSGRLIGFI